MIAELTKEKKYQSSEFLILPMSFNVAGILGPIMGGLLADPSTTLPGMFGAEAPFGFEWIQAYPYALPGVLNALFLAVTAAIVYLGFGETLKARRGRFDFGLYLGERLWNIIHFRSRYNGGNQYYMIDGNSCLSSTRSGFSTPDEENFEPKKPDVGPVQILPFKRIWTKNVILTLITIAFFDFHMGAFNNLWSLFLFTPRRLVDGASSITPVHFTGGLGMPAPTVGLATSILGCLVLFLQLLLYPPIHSRLGTTLSLRTFLLFFSPAYFLAPYLSLLPSSMPAPSPSSSPFVWLGFILVLLLQVAARTFTLPATIMMINNCSPDPSVLGIVHGIGQSVGAFFRTIAPVVSGWWYGEGLEVGMVGYGWWGIAAAAGVGCTYDCFLGL